MLAIIYARVYLLYVHERVASNHKAFICNMNASAIYYWLASELPHAQLSAAP